MRAQWQDKSDMAAIVERHRTFARELVELAQKHNMKRISATFEPTFDLVGVMGAHPVTVDWQQGTHGEPGEVRLSCYVAEVSEVI